MVRGWRWVLGLGWLVGTGAWAQQDLYTCVDAQGHRHTADRPIAECTDREQQVLGGAGLVRRVVPPNLTLPKQMKAEEAQRRKNEELTRQTEEKNRDRALLMRYPTPAALEKDRQDQLAVVDGVVLSIKTRLTELDLQGKNLAAQMEFYAKDPSKAPPTLKAKFLENLKLKTAQQKAMGDQEAEKLRVNQHFDELVSKLQPRWERPVQMWTAPASAK